MTEYFWSVIFVRFYLSTCKYIVAFNTNIYYRNALNRFVLILITYLYGFSSKQNYFIVYEYFEVILNATTAIKTGKGLYGPFITIVFTR